MNSEMILGVVRHVLGLAAGYMVAKGHMKGEYVEMLVNSVIGLGVVGWSIGNKMASPLAEGRAASAVASAVPAPVAKTVAFLCGLLLFAPALLAEGLPRAPSKVWTPSPLLEKLNPSPSGAFYLSVVGSHFSEEGAFDDGQFRAGLGFGYLMKYNSFGFGVDVDATRNLESYDDERKFDSELDNWNWSARARVGYFVTPNVMPYVSAGYGRIFTLDTATYGLGVQTFLTDRVSLRFEATKYEVDDSLLDLKLSVDFKLN